MLPDRPPSVGSSRPNGGASEDAREGWAGSLSVSGMGAGTTTSSRYADFSPTELAVVCSHYDLGVIQSIKPVRVGSPTSPKARIKTHTGDYLLKRRENGADDPFKVAATHAVQIHLASAGFPTPRIIGTRGENNSMLQLRGRVYELFSFVEGRRPNGSEVDCAASGAALAQFFDTARTVRTRWEAPAVTYHNAAGIEDQANTAIGKTSAQVQPIIERLVELFLTARARSDGLGLSDQGLVHGDWHPGNLIVAEGQVRGVMDFDSVRVAPRAVDLANGLLQFSIEANGAHPGVWEAAPSAPRSTAFLAGYRAICGQQLTNAEVEALGPLMIQALIAESLLPIARTGRFATLDAHAFLEAIWRKAAWLEDRGLGELTGAQ